MVASNSFKTMNSATFCMDLRSSNGILESVLSAVTLRELDRQTRARNVHETKDPFENETLEYWNL